MLPKRVGFLSGALLVLTALASGCASQTNEPVITPALKASESVSASAQPTQPATPQIPSCSPQVQAMSVEQKVGQMLMVGVYAGTSYDQAIADLTTVQAGSALLLGDRYGASTVADESGALKNAIPGLMIAVDQEGGQVQRLNGEGFTAIPDAVIQGQETNEQLTQDWAFYGSQLRNAGIDYDLAPIGDVVPADLAAINQPIGVTRRGYSSDAQEVAEKNAAVITGLKQANIASSVKHFPGLGYVAENTDFAVGYDTVSTLSDEELTSFKAAIDAGVSSVMVSSAIYTQVDADNPAVFSRLIIDDILRNRLGFDGVVISDDLGVAKSVENVPAADRATRFYQAGGDLLITADSYAASQMAQATISAAYQDPQFASTLDAKTERILNLKQSLGLITCG